MLNFRYKFILLIFSSFIFSSFIIASTNISINNSEVVINEKILPFFKINKLNKENIERHKKELERYFFFEKHKDSIKVFSIIVLIIISYLLLKNLQEPISKLNDFFKNYGLIDALNIESKNKNENNKKRKRTIFKLILSKLSQFGGFFTSIFIFFISQLPRYISDAIFDSIFKNIKSKISTFYETKSLSWFIAKKTKFKALFNQVLSNSIAFDTHSKFLNNELYKYSFDINLEQAVEELIEAKNKNNPMLSNVFVDIAKTKLKEKAAKFNNLERYLLISLVQKERLKYGLNCDPFFNFEQQKSNFVCTVNKLIENIEMILAFIELSFRQHILMLKSKELADLTDKYVDLLNSLINLNFESIEIESKKQNGFFSLTYDFYYKLTTYFQEINTYYS